MRRNRAQRSRAEGVAMTQNMRPVSLTLLAWLHIGVGTVGFVSHFSGIHGGALACNRVDGIPRYSEHLWRLQPVRHPLSVLCRDRLASLSSRCRALFPG